MARRIEELAEPSIDAWYEKRDDAALSAYLTAFGDQLRHAYERIELETIWRATTDDLPPLKAAALRALTPPPANPKEPA